MHVIEKTLEDSMSLLAYSTFKKPVDYTDEAFHKDVFDHLSTTIVPHAPAKSCPPPPVLIYAARNIIKPTFVLSQIADLLLVLGQVNIARKLALSKTATVLKWNKRYHRYPEAGVSTLPLAEEKRLNRVLQRADRCQELYRHIVNTCYEVDIRQTFLHGSPQTFWLKMQTYFPGQFSDECNDADALAALMARMGLTHTYHYDLSTEELRDSKTTGLRCAKFARDAAQYLEDPGEYCAQIGVPPHTPIDTVFPLPDTVALARSVDQYLEQVLRSVVLLERLFGAKEP